MKVVIGEILPLALVVTISPLNIIPAILLLFTRRPLANALNFLLGFVVGLTVVLALLVLVGGAIDLAPGSGHSTWPGILKLVLGGYLLIAAVRKFRSRPRDDEEGSLPGWMNGIGSYTPLRSLGAGAALGALNPKNVVVALASAAAIAAGGLTIGQRVVASAIYVLVAALGVATPIVTMLALGNRAPEVLEGWNVWLRRNNASVMSVLFLVFGVVLIGQGISGI